MSDEKNNMSEKNEPNDDIIRLLIDKGKEMYQQDFSKFSAITVGFLTVGLWLIKSIWYAFYTGRFSVYSIDTSYISADNENIILEIIQMLSLFVIWILINYAYYKIAKVEDTSKITWKKVLNIALFWVLESVSVYFIICYLDFMNPIQILLESSIEQVVALLILLSLCCLSLNIFALEFLIEERSKRKKSKNKIKKKNEVFSISKEKRIKNMFLIIIFTAAVEIAIAYISARGAESKRVDYKVLLEPINIETESLYNIECVDYNNAYKMFPIIYEDRECYIVTRLYNDKDGVRIDYDYQKVIEKDGQEVIHIRNVYEVNKSN